MKEGISVPVDKSRLFSPEYWRGLTLGQDSIEDFNDIYPTRFKGSHENASASVSLLLYLLAHRTYIRKQHTLENGEVFDASDYDEGTVIIFDIERLGNAKTSDRILKHSDIDPPEYQFIHNPRPHPANYQHVAYGGKERYEHITYWGLIYKNSKRKSIGLATTSTDKINNLLHGVKPRKLFSEPEDLLFTYSPIHTGNVFHYELAPRGDSSAAPYERALWRTNAVIILEEKAGLPKREEDVVTLRQRLREFIVPPVPEVNPTWV